MQIMSFKNLSYIFQQVSAQNSRKNGFGYCSRIAEIKIVQNQAWLEKSVPGCFSRYFSSPNQNCSPDFTGKNKYLFDKKHDGWYNCFVCQFFGKNFSRVSFVHMFLHLIFFCPDDVIAAENFVSKLRPIYPIHRQQRKENSSNRPMETIDLTDDNSDTTG